MLSAPGLPPSPGGGGVKGSSGFWSSAIFWFSGFASVLSSQVSVGRDRTPGRPLPESGKQLYLKELNGQLRHCQYTTEKARWRSAEVDCFRSRTSLQGITRLRPGDDLIRS